MTARLPADAPSDIATATRRYEAWIAKQTTPVASDLALKHARMATTPFRFLRATFYRWAQRWSVVCPVLAEAPPLLAVGDLHIENFGTWRDIEGRLVWGINDFDEAFAMPYTNDLVRLATSALLAARENALTIKADEICTAILDGYRAGIESGGGAFVLERDHRWLRRLAIGELREPVAFWARMDALPDCIGAPPRKVAQFLAASLPEPGLDFRVVHRIAGLGSLGHQRFVALAEWRGGSVAREAKALAKSAYGWATGATRRDNIRYKKVLRRAIRCPDPSIEIHGNWLIRRLAPDCSRIELTDIAKRTNEADLLHAMGRETANIHLGSSAAGAVGHDLAHRRRDWLVEAAMAMAEATIADWKAWKRDGPAQ
jgi:uncharacterized protein DUF2252